ncbi:hypothetical protein, partial [Staphylococcus aureus]|uniref:hypothetical protein n=1 Tax=Staphylococcus aureus TaxID=1280 RepID=UPI003F7AE51A
MKLKPYSGYTERTSFGICAPLKPATRLGNLPGLANLRKTTCQGGFFVYRQQITRRKKGSQEDPLIFLLQTSLFDSPESVLV